MRRNKKWKLSVNQHLPRIAFTFLEDVTSRRHMHLKKLLLGLALLVASTPQVLAMSPRSPSALLVPRQAVVSCRVDVCDAYRRDLATCRVPVCVCTSAAFANFMDCMKCATSNNPNAIEQLIQMATDYQTTCAGLGAAVPFPTDLPRSGSSLTDTAPTSTPTSVGQNTIRPSTTAPVDTTDPLTTGGAGVPGGNAGVTGGAPSTMAGRGVAILFGVALGIVAVAV
ncbi:hypothetical protein B0H34DRAFT_65134 [Crassisporium funariophilum]|nr:hypothetical protein B0H34DRAFT_65134 [Crassisporium funariophilum]